MRFKLTIWCLIAVALAAFWGSVAWLGVLIGSLL
jgi:hypothetical protein